MRTGAKLGLLVALASALGGGGGAAGSLLLEPNERLLVSRRGPAALAGAGAAVAAGAALLGASGFSGFSGSTGAAFAAASSALRFDDDPNECRRCSLAAPPPPLGCAAGAALGARPDDLENILPAAGTGASAGAGAACAAAACAAAAACCAASFSLRVASCCRTRSRRLVACFVARSRICSCVSRAAPCSSGGRWLSSRSRLKSANATSTWPMRARISARCRRLELRSAWWAVPQDSRKAAS